MDSARIIYVPIASSGKTGTTRGYFGSRGFPHLHFEVFTGADARWPSGKQSNPMSLLRGGRFGWPLACR